MTTPTTPARVAGERLQSEMERLANSARPDKRFYADVIRELLELRSKLEAARPALERYGQHDNDCTRWVHDEFDIYAGAAYDETQPCSCGYEAVLRSLSEPK